MTDPEWATSYGTFRAFPTHDEISHPLSPLSDFGHPPPLCLLEKVRYPQRGWFWVAPVVVDYL